MDAQPDTQRSQKELKCKIIFRGKVKHSLIGIKNSVGKDLEIPYKPNLAVPVTITFKMPTLFSRSRSNDDEIDRMRTFFEDEKGSVAVSQAVCSTHRVDISPRASKTMTTSFIEAVKGLHLVSNETMMKQNSELKRFVNEFGTHYAQQTVLGKSFFVFVSSKYM